MPGRLQPAVLTEPTIVCDPEPRATTHTFRQLGYGRAEGDREVHADHAHVPVKVTGRGGQLVLHEGSVPVPQRHREEGALQRAFVVADVRPFHQDLQPRPPCKHMHHRVVGVCMASAWPQASFCADRPLPALVASEDTYHWGGTWDACMRVPASLSGQQLRDSPHTSKVQEQNRWVGKGGSSAAGCSSAISLEQ